MGDWIRKKIREEDPENQGIGMNITGVLHYEDKVYPCEMDIVIFAGQEKTLSTKERVLELVRLQDSATRQKAYLTLPPSLDGRKIAWTEEKDSKSDSDSDARNGDKHSACRKRNTERKQSEEDEKRADDAGLSGNYHRVYDADRCRNDSEKCVEKDCGRLWDHQGKNGRKREAYEEIWKTWQEMKSGIPEMECYERFARRCDLIPYMKMGALLSQNLKKGSKRNF